MSLELMNGNLVIEVFYDKQDKEYEDNICFCVKEICPEDEKILYANETNLFITPEEARKLAEMLMDAAENSSHASR